MAYSFFTPLKHFSIVFKAETNRLVTYRAQFWFELVASSAVELLVAFYIWKAVFESSGALLIDNYSFNSMLLYVVVAIFFSQATRGTGVGTFQREIYEGSLTRYLIYPLSIYSYKLGTFLPRSVFAVGQLVIALIIYNIFFEWPQEISFNIINIIFGLITLMLACLIYFYMIVCIESLAFWVDNVWALSYTLQIAVVFLSGKLIPLDLFPAWGKSLVEFSPFPYFAYIPAQVSLGFIPYDSFFNILFIELVWLVVSISLAKLLVRQGLYSYTGVGQ
jgi:ABC-2 type transport system permease protein